MRIPNLDTGNAVTFSNSNGVSFGTNGDVVTGSIANSVGGIAVNAASTVVSGTVVFSNSNNITFGINGSTITASASYSQSTAPSGIAINNATTYTSGTVVFSNGNGVTFGTNGQTITASVNAGSVAPGAIAAGTQTATSGTIIFSNSNNVTFGMQGSSVITASATYAPTMPYYQNMMGFMMQGSSFNTFSVMPLNFNGPLPGLITANTFGFGINATSSQSTASGSIMFNFGVYTLNGSTLSLLNSVSTQITYAAVSNNSTAFSGPRWLTVHSSQWSAQPTFSVGNYWLGYIISSSNQTQGVNLMGQAFMNATGRFGTAGVNATNSQGSVAWFPFFGAYTVTTASLPTSVNQSDINAAQTSVGNFLPHVMLNNMLPTF